MHPIASALLAWYDLHARKLPWRGIHDPYRTWVSEAMLQQTRVDTVIPYYHRFLAAFPSLQALADAPEDAVLKCWEGLGYYSRARNLHQGARQVMEQFGGAIPGDPVTLRKIRGIGPYTAAAIASIAFDVPVPAVDGNVIRVLSRLRGVRDNPALGPVRSLLDQLAAELVPARRPGDYNQAVMDLGATICVPGTPDCDFCPLRGFCDALRAGDAASLPAIPSAHPPREVPYDLLILRCGGRVLMRRRSEKLLEGLWCFPLLEGHRPKAELPAFVRKKMGLQVSALASAGEAKHVFTHQVWRMRLYTGAAEEPLLPSDRGEYRWFTTEELAALAIPTAMRAAMKCLR